MNAETTGYATYGLPKEITEQMVAAMAAKIEERMIGGLPGYHLDTEELAVLARRARDRGWLMRVVRTTGGQGETRYTANFLGRSGELVSAPMAWRPEDAIACGLRELSKHPSMKNV